jgi:hypothetical protein
MSNYRIDKSNINGQGVIATEKIKKDEIVDVAIYFYYFVPVVTKHIGQYVNHQNNNNCELHYENKRYFFKACKDIYPEEELTMDYNKTPWYVMKSMPWYSEVEGEVEGGSPGKFKSMEGSGRRLLQTKSYPLWGLHGLMGNYDESEAEAESESEAEAEAESEAEAEAESENIDEPKQTLEEFMDML